MPTEPEEINSDHQDCFNNPGVTIDEIKEVVVVLRDRVHNQRDQIQANRDRMQELEDRVQTLEG